VLDLRDLTAGLEGAMVGVVLRMSDLTAGMRLGGACVEPPDPTASVGGGGDGDKSGV
jgi:hypothetical protein